MMHRIANFKLDFSVILRDVFEGSNGAACMKHINTGFFMVVHVMATTELMFLKQPTLFLSNKSSNVSAAQFRLHFPYETYMYILVNSSLLICHHRIFGRRTKQLYALCILPKIYHHKHFA